MEYLSPLAHTLRGTMVSKRYINYLRVSTARQGENGLGVEAQRETVRRYLVSHHGEQIAEFVEVEIGKRSDRPQLTAAKAWPRGAQGHSAGSDLTIAAEHERHDRRARTPSAGRANRLQARQ